MIEIKTENTVYYYDTETVSIAQNIDDVFSCKIHSRVVDGKATKYPKLLNIVVGTACNMHCVYCSQHESFVQKNFNTDFTKYIDCSYLSDVNIWGGEPLAYNTFKPLVKFFKENYPHVKIHTVTNGSLLDISMTDFLIENGVHVRISHDGPAHKELRKTDPLDYHLTNIRRLLKNGANLKAVITKYTVSETYQYLRDAIGFDFDFYTSPIRVYTTDNSDIWYPTDQQMQIIQDDIYESLINDTCRDRRLLKAMKTACDFIRFESTPYTANILGGCTIHNRSAIYIDMNGNYLSCHVLTEPVGRLGEPEHPPIDGTLNPKCSSCPAFVTCHGSCISIPDEMFDLNCKVSYAYNIAIFKAAFFKVFGEHIISMEQI